MPQPMDSAAGCEASLALLAIIGQRQARVLQWALVVNDGNCSLHFALCLLFSIPFYFYTILTVCCQVSLQFHKLVGVSTLTRNYMLRLRESRQPLALLKVVVLSFPALSIVILMYQSKYSKPTTLTHLLTQHWGLK
jgi:hypothetical protein